MARNIAVTIECFVHKDGKYLMLHRNPTKRIMPGVWMAPGGHREFNEGVFECARREIREETGLEIKNLRIKAVGNAFCRDINQEFYFTFVFADYDSGDLRENPADGELVWVTPEEMAKLPNLLSEIHHVLPSLLDGTDRVISYKAEYEAGNTLTFFELEK